MSNPSLRRPRAASQLWSRLALVESYGLRLAAVESTASTLSAQLAALPVAAAAADLASVSTRVSTLTTDVTALRAQVSASCPS